MITRDEAAVASWVTGGWAVNLWTDYFEPGLQAILLITTVVGAVIVVWNRILDNKMKRKELRNWEDSH